jgi:hypothetical protein
MQQISSQTTFKDISKVANLHISYELHHAKEYWIRNIDMLLLLFVVDDCRKRISDWEIYGIFTL